MNAVNMYIGVMETIQSIDEYDDMVKPHSGEAGYIIKTNLQEIILSIDNYQSCCESWGYFLSEDDCNSFIGARIIGITVTDACLNTKKLNDQGIDIDENGQAQVYEGGIMFVNIETTKGTLQFTAYNEHNGYYGHDARVISRQLEHETCI